jgi:hypothetical protein
MQLQINPLVDTHRHDPLNVTGARPESQPIEGVQGATLIAGAGGRLVLFPGRERRNGTRQADRQKDTGEFGAPHRHEDFRSGQTTALLLSTQNYEKVAALVGY